MTTIKIKLSELKSVIKDILKEELTRNPVDIGHFIKGDEVYLEGDNEPLGMVIGIGKKNIIVKRHIDGKKVAVEPNKLYLGKELSQYNDDLLTKTHFQGLDNDLDNLSIFSK